MRKTLGRITVFAVLFLTLGIGLFLVAVWTVDDAIHYAPVLTSGVLDTSKVSATSVYIFDVETGKEIASKEKNRELPIASVTKLLTASLFYRDAPLEATTSIVWNDVTAEGESGKLRYGQVYSYRELMYPLLLESSNDAGVTMLRVQPLLLDAMNAYVKERGLVHTILADTSGLSSKNISTAGELGTVMSHLYRDFPHIFDITRLSQFIGTNTGWRNNNPLVQEEGYRGGKHGFTYEANRTDVAFFEEKIASGQERMIGYVLLGSDNIKNDIDILRAQVVQNVYLE